MRFIIWGETIPLSSFRKNLNRNNRSVVRRIMDVLDLYITGKLTCDDAHIKIQHLYSQFERQENRRGIAVASEIKTLLSNLQLDHYSEILRCRDMLKEHL